MDNFRRRCNKNRTITRTTIHLTYVLNTGTGIINIINGGPETLTQLEQENLIIDVNCFFYYCLRTYYSDGSFEDSPEKEFDETIRFDLFYIDYIANDYIECNSKIINTPYGDVHVRTNGIDRLNDNGTMVMSVKLIADGIYYIDDFRASYQKVANHEYSVSFNL